MNGLVKIKKNHLSIQEPSSFDVVEPPPQEDDPFATISQANAEQVPEPTPEPIPEPIPEPVAAEQPPTDQLQVAKSKLSEYIIGIIHFISETEFYSSSTTIVL